MGELHVTYYDEVGRLQEIDLCEGDWLKTNNGPVYVHKIDFRSMILFGAEGTSRTSQSHVVAMITHGKWEKLA